MNIDLLVKHQYQLPKTLYAYAEYFPHVSFVQTLQLYQIAVEETLIMYREKNLFEGSLSFGRGLMYARNLWLEKMKTAERIYVKKLEELNADKSF